jgi:GNAT superfamily N-acetyltransferase
VPTSLPSYRISRLQSGHDRSQFSCGNYELDRYIRELAGQDQRRDVTRVYVALAEGTNRVIGYYTLSSDSVDLYGLPDSLIRRLPRYPHIPCVLIGRLAVANEMKGRGMGRRLLADAFQRILYWESEIAVWAIIVEAIDDHAIEFYRKFAFKPFEDDPRRLFLPVATLRRATD